MGRVGCRSLGLGARGVYGHRLLALLRLDAFSLSEVSYTLACENLLLQAAGISRERIYEDPARKEVLAL